MTPDRQPRAPIPVDNLIAGEERAAMGGRRFEKRSPTSGKVQALVARSSAEDVSRAVLSAADAQVEWASRTVESRGRILRKLAALLERDREAVAAMVADETGKSRRDADSETDGAIEMGYFVAGEGRRFYGRTTTSAVPGRQAMTIRRPIGVAALIVAANTPIANVAWKAFPALLCGNGCVLKPSENAPRTALEFGRLAAEAGVPAGALNVVHGLGSEAGSFLVDHDRVDVLSFTGSSDVGRHVASAASMRLCRVCLELGGKNPLVVCDDADLERAADAAVLSAFSNAGQRCAAASRLLVFDAVYDRFRDLLLERCASLRVGPTDDDDLGPVISQEQLDRILAVLARARECRAQILAGGHRLMGPQHREGYYLAPTLIESAADEGGELDRIELFGPVATLRRVPDFDSAVRAANRSPYALTAAIWTSSVHRGQEFALRAVGGVTSINGATYGSEPHLPFGGERDSGTGWREAGPEALDVFSSWKTVYVNHDPSLA